MKRYWRLCFLSALVIAAGGFGGCAEETAEIETTVKNPYAGAVSMEETPVVDYVVPKLSPNVLVDREGYSLDGGKTAAVRGKSLPGEFRLVDAATGEAVLTGLVTDIVYHAEQGLYSGVVDFSDYSTEGDYYLECDILGRSYDFTLQKEYYQTLFTETYEGMMEDCQQRTAEISDVIMLLEVYEWYPSLFPDADRDEMPDVLKEIRGWVAHMEENGVEAEEEALYAALLAKFGYLYQKFDHKYATDSLKRASTVLGQTQTTISRDADSFYALTELYRATGRYTYRNQIVDYKSFFEDNSSYLEEPCYLFGIMTYMATRQKVDVELCGKFMNRLMERAEEISGRYTEMLHPVTARNNGSAELLERAVELSCANYVMNNYQYTGIEENFLHYLMGQNPDSISFYENGEDRARYLLLLAQLAENDAKSE